MTSPILTILIGKPQYVSLNYFHVTLKGVFFSDCDVCILPGWSLFWMLYGSFQALQKTFGVFLIHLWYRHKVENVLSDQLVRAGYTG